VLNVISRSSFELEPVFSTIVETAGRLCHADFAIVLWLGDVAHVSVRPSCYPGSHLASPVGDHDCPCTIFPGSPWLKRSLAYTPGASGSPRSSIAVCRPSLAGTVSDKGGTLTTRHDREPLRTRKVLPLG
jgi:hypothetical protein